MSTYETASVFLAAIALVISAYSIMSATAAKRSAIAAETQAEAARLQAEAAADQVGFLSGNLMRDRAAELEAEIRYGLDMPNVTMLRQLNDLGTKMDGSQEGFTIRALTDLMTWIGNFRAGAREFEHRGGRPETIASRAELARAAVELEQSIGRATYAFVPGAGRFNEFSAGVDPRRRHELTTEACDAVDAFRTLSGGHREALSAENRLYRGKMASLEARLLQG